MTTAAGATGTTTYRIQRVSPTAAACLLAVWVSLCLVAAAFPAFGAADVPVICASTPDPLITHFLEQHGISAPAPERHHPEVIDDACLPVDIREAFRRVESLVHFRICLGEQALCFLPDLIAFLPGREAHDASPAYIASNCPSRAPPLLAA